MVVDNVKTCGTCFFSIRAGNSKTKIHCNCKSTNGKTKEKRQLSIYDLCCDEWQSKDINQPPKAINDKKPNKKRPCIRRSKNHCPPNGGK